MLSFLPSALLALTLPQFIFGQPKCGLVPPRDATAGSKSTSTGTGTGTSSSSGDDDIADVLANGWYPGWLADDNPPSNISWNKYNTLTFAFATTTSDVNTVALDSISQQALPQFVTEAQAHNVTAILSIGGWSGSMYFSNAMATAQNRSAFVKTVLGLVEKYDVNGIEFDWEYPAKQGIGCNTVSTSDSENFLSFLQELRKDPTGAQLVLAAAVSITPWVGSSGEPMTDVSAFAKVLDHISIMNYDIWGSWSPTVGPNAPLNDSCAPIQDGSAVSAVKAWTSAGFPADQISLGLAAYGHSFDVSNSNAISSSNSKELKLYPAFNAGDQPHGDSQDGQAGTDECGNSTPVGGIFNFWGLVDGGFLTTAGTAANGIDYVFDNCSQTPFVYNPTSDVMVSFDDATSYAAKGKFINSMGLKGFSVWHILGDYDDILLDAVSAAMGIETVCTSSS
ncbi:glycoside hydrolase family 18 protein [Lentinula aff. detonsa]|uniref:Glycoside hydrolase family 18 protein n=1 Tax=Lentinula aff. detonsa TaxID=2804958 RepID=A0AA38NNH0_9AGAR|nr:glycoside hydrolase family 18 protein [Lentinula aff. detonsa]